VTDQKPTKWAIAQHWAKVADGEVFAPHLDLESPCCFACGWYSEYWVKATPKASWERARLERAHIVAAGLGGSEHASNLILLCAPCHEESPDWFDPWEMAVWISRRPDRPSKEMEQLGLWLEAIEDVRDFPEVLAKVASAADGVELFADAMRSASQGAVVHGAGVGLRKATMAAVLRRASAEILGKKHLQQLPTPRARLAAQAVCDSARLPDTE
jgi:hypothetical protein